MNKLGHTVVLKPAAKVYLSKLKGFLL